MLLDCPNCEAKVEVRELHSYEWNTDDGIPVDTDRLTLVACQRCSAPMLAHQELDYSGQAGDVPWAPPDRIYPPKHAISPVIPDLLRDSFSEARRCVETRCYVAAALMCRRTLEALCQHFGVKGKNLADGLRKLHQDKIIDDRLFEWAEALRHDGNLAAHEPAARINREDATDLVDFTYAIMEYVFVLRDRFEAFKQRRATAKKKTPPA